MPTERAAVVSQDAGGSRWEYAVRAPTRAIGAWVRAYNGYREWACGPSLRREVSGTRVTFIVDLGPPIAVTMPDGTNRYPSGFVAGLHDGYAVTRHDGYQEGVQIDLTPIGARLLFAVPMHELTGHVVALDLLGFPSLTDRLRELATWDARFDLLDTVLTQRFGALELPGRVTQWAVDHIERAGGDVHIAALAKDLGYSTKHVTRLFREHVGVGPKHFARLVRFERMLRAAEADSARSWADLAAAFGYFDQAHLAREVKDLTGLTPTELRAERADVAFIAESRDAWDPKHLDPKNLTTNHSGSTSGL